MAKVKIFAPNKQYSGKTGGVVFVDGVAEADDEKHESELKFFKRHKKFGIGEPVEEEDAVDESEEDTDGGEAQEPDSGKEPVDIPGMPNSKATRSEWAEFAESMGITTEGLSIAQMKEKVIAEHSK